MSDDRQKQEFFKAVEALNNGMAKLAPLLAEIGFFDDEEPYEDDEDEDEENEDGEV